MAYEKQLCVSLRARILFHIVESYFGSHPLRGETREQPFICSSQKGLPFVAGFIQLLLH